MPPSAFPATCTPSFVPPPHGGGRIISLTPLARRGLSSCDSRSCGLPEAADRDGPSSALTDVGASLWPCSRWGLPSSASRRKSVSSYLTFSPLPGLSARRFVFCGTVHARERLCTPRVLRGTVPWELGLSSPLVFSGAIPGCCKVSSLISRPAPRSPVRPPACCADGWNEGCAGARETQIGPAARAPAP